MNAPVPALARLLLAASGLLAAFVALMPAAIAGLIALFDVSAHGLLGMSGTLLGLAAPFGGDGGGLPVYHGVTSDLPRAAVLSILRGVPPIGMIVLAMGRTGLNGRARWVAATVLAVASTLTSGWLALPGLAAASCLAWQAYAERSSMSANASAARLR